MADYTTGTADPVVKPDPGAGIWNSTPKTSAMQAFKASVWSILPHAYVIIGDDAAKHMSHYLGNTGKAYTIDLADMIDDVRSAKALYELELFLAKKYVESLPVGAHKITSTRHQEGYNHKHEKWNWYYAVGGYASWGKGTATVTRDGKGKRRYRMDFEYRFLDRYNWDKGKSVEIFGIKITDDVMGELHRQGLAKEFNMHGSIKRTVEWDTPAHYDGPLGRRGRRR